jgi:hypothetical protein
MRRRLLFYLKNIINWLQNQHNRFISKENGTLPYVSLSPIGNADIGNDYKKALDWALKNRKEHDIKNIALTGPYGSGKSSILKTYIASNPGQDLHFLYISLATFKEEEDNTDAKSREELLRLIELSILQQIFYHEEDRKIPDSRFRKIKNYTRWNLVTTALAVFLLIASILNLVYPSELEILLKTEFNLTTKNIIHYLSFAVTVLAFWIIIYKSIRTINGIKISKLNIQNAEININENVNKSILNHHIDEILYFFEVTEYNIVVIEDLDRFKQTEIFTKLREINLLVNNSKKINKEVVFIYAVRDDMFKADNERTKFFDFIIPVIPVINPSNSSQKLLEKQILHDYKISENLIDSISLFIDDMRMLYNILNEFYLYRQKLNKSLNQDMLLSMMVYKNIFPNDFTLLSNNKGLLYNAINNKQKYINAEISKIESEISQMKAEIKELEYLKIEDVRELRYLYLLFYATSLSGFVSFHVAGDDVTPSEMASEENFDYLVNNKAQYRYIQSYSALVSKIPTQFAHVEKKVDSDLTYAERKKLIDNWNNNKVEALKKQIQQKEVAKSQTRNLKVRELLEKSNLEIDIADVKQKNLVSVLLRNGFINEDYLDYVSLFYEGSITKSDHQFLINVKTQTSTEFNYKLNKIDKLISKINEFEFEKEYVLNYNLLDEVLNGSQYKNIKERIFAKLKDQSEASIKFIDGFLDFGTNIDAFIRELVKTWTNIWTFLENKSSFTQERKGIYFKLIFEKADVQDIKKLYDSNDFKSYLLQRKDFLSIVPEVDKLKTVIKTLAIKFIELDINYVPSKDLIDYIYTGNFYALNIPMIKLILSMDGKQNESDFNTKNYSTILNSNLNKLKDNVHQNINEYVQNVYLKLTNNTQEDQESLIEVLNNNELKIENKLSIVKQVDTKVDHLSSINDLEIQELLLEESKVLPLWRNLYHYYEKNENQISESIAFFLQNTGNAATLSKTKIEKDVSGERKYTDFILKLITNNEFNDVAYENILKSVPYHFMSLGISALSKNKVSLLLKYSILTFNNTNYQSLKEVFPGLHIQFLEKNKSKYLITILDFELDNNDVLMILKSTNFTLSEKNQLIEKISEDLVVANADSIKTLGELILTNNSFRVTGSLLKLILQNSGLSLERRIRIHNWKYDQLEVGDYTSFLTSLGEPYSEIAINGKRPLIINNEYNLKLVEILDSRNYISKYDIEEKGIRISTFRKSNES